MLVRQPSEPSPKYSWRFRRSAGCRRNRSGRESQTGRTQHSSEPVGPPKLPTADRGSPPSNDRATSAANLVRERNSLPLPRRFGSRPYLEGCEGSLRVMVRRAAAPRCRWDRTARGGPLCLLRQDQNRSRQPGRKAGAHCDLARLSAQPVSPLPATSPLQCGLAPSFAVPPLQLPDYRRRRLGRRSQGQAKRLPRELRRLAKARSGRHGSQPSTGIARSRGGSDRLPGRHAWCPCTRVSDGPLRVMIGFLRLTAGSRLCERGLPKLPQGVQGRNQSEHGRGPREQGGNQRGKVPYTNAPKVH